MLVPRTISCMEVITSLTPPAGFAFVAYPNRDSTGYKERYNIPEAQTVVR